MSMGTPGRDHWGNSMFCLLGGGGVKGGRIVGSTNHLGEVRELTLHRLMTREAIFQILAAFEKVARRRSREEEDSPRDEVADAVST